MDNEDKNPKAIAELGGRVDAVVMHDLQWEDINYANGFPANICTNSCVVVQIPEKGQGVVLYTCKVRGTQAKCFLPLEFADKYTSDIYVFGS